LPRPDVPEWLEWVWRAWHRLNLDRPYFGGGMGPMVPGRIAWRDVVTWCEFHDLPGEAVGFLDRCIVAMDTEFVGFQAAKAAKKPPPWREGVE
jgi:hypothetical protein